MASKNVRKNRTKADITEADRKSIFTRVREAVAAGDHAAASDLQLEMARKMRELTGLYGLYRGNIDPG